MVSIFILNKIYKRQIQGVIFKRLSRGGSLGKVLSSTRESSLHVSLCWQDTNGLFFYSWQLGTIQMGLIPKGSLPYSIGLWPV